MFVDFSQRGERGRKRNINWLPPVCALTGDGARNLSMCPDRELNPQPFGVWEDAPTTSYLAMATHSFLTRLSYGLRSREIGVLLLVFIFVGIVFDYDLKWSKNSLTDLE